MQEELFSQLSEYVFGGLFVALFLYVLHSTRRREDRLMEHNEKLQNAFQETAETMKSMKNEMSKDLREIKETLKIHERNSLGRRSYDD